MEQGMRAPEWFIGGPADGQDKLARFPDAQSAVMFNEIVGHDLDGIAVAQRVYRLKRFAIGRTVLSLWIVDGMDDQEAGTRFAEILLAPHMVRAEGAPGE